jgi:exopolyphosphatase/guanosine-5'-triphosphate,3'-diphosphate pyrophosphatase
VREFRDAGSSDAAGASGTIRTVAAACRVAGWCAETLTQKALRRFVRELVALGHADKLTQLPGLKASRAPIIAGGAAILLAAFDSLQIEELQIATGALQEGVLYDLLGRIHHEDVRERSIRLFQERYHVDRTQALRVERTARELLDGVALSWGLDSEPAQRFLAWAARLHEVGLMIAYNHHHRHGAYLVANADMPGFSQDDQQLLAVVIGSHRRRVHPEVFEVLGRSRRELAQRLIVLLRLAVLLNRGRSSEPLPPVLVQAGAGGLCLRLLRAWLDANPLTRVDLEGEVTALEDLALKLVVEEF